ncbi:MULTISPECIES: Rieske 2Fe-2S domain-containing protein [Acinetobacter]|uniref:Rieske (2Fe-2S) protein n=1 Tax=Acinetobacter TaxID=469 RepID=UPI0012509DB4|nr:MULTISPECIES: Rieske 2Fe-2S domain-containing protein [Acinetobacter]MBJ9952233.1 Rieske 2Fe-2S domain-containing protein [Acinetobacter baumannii]MDR6539966.1 nitrite reductase/ring-hydroxylating ferredoxin subunit [Acinetobacter bereziniae]
MTIRFQVPTQKVPKIGERTFLQVKKKFLVLFNIEGKFYAIDDSCPHQGASLFSGQLDGKVIQCCAHGLRFDVESGHLLNSTHLRVNSYRIELDNENLYIVMGSGE